MAAALAFAAGTAFAMPKGWTDDFDAAKAQAAKEGKLLLVDFSGSDWCGWCKKLDKEVFAKPEFVEQASKDFVLVLIDSPNDKSKLSAKAKKENPKLCKKYKIKGYPTVLLMDAEGKVLGKTGYKDGGPGKYLKHLAKLKKKAEKRAANGGSSTPAGWTDDFDAAKAQAAKEGKFLLVDFSGSDWCGWCMKLDEEVFSKPEFVEEAKKEYVLVLIDSPRDDSILSEKAKEQNPKLCKQYKIQGFPSVLMMDADGSVLGKTGYQKGGPEKYLKHLAKLKKAAAAKVDFLKSISGLAKGSPARIAKIDEFLGELDDDDLEDNEEFVMELLAADKGKYAKKYPEFAYIKPLEKKLEESMESIQEDFTKRVKEFGSKASEEQLKVVGKEMSEAVKAKFAEIKKEAEDAKAGAPEAAEKIDEFIQKLDYISNAIEKQMNEIGGNKKKKGSGGKKSGGKKKVKKVRQPADK